MISIVTHAFTHEQVKNIAEHYKATYVLDNCLRAKAGGWANIPVAIFYTEEAHPEGSNYFGIFRSMDGSIRITNGISGTEPFDGVMASNGEIIYSSYRHHYNTSSDGSVSIDGGRDYLKISGEPPYTIVKLGVEKDKVVILDRKEE